MTIAPLVHETGEAIDQMAEITKIVTVDPTGIPGVNCDFNTIAQAAVFLKSFPGNIGGIINLRGASTYPVSTIVNVEGLTIQGGRYTPAPIILAVNGGQLISNGTKFRSVVISVPAAFTGPAGETFLLNYNSNSMGDFFKIDFRPDNTRSILGNTGGAVTINLSFRICGQSLQVGGIIVNGGSAFTTPLFVIYGNNGLGTLQFATRPLSVDQQARYDVTPLSLGGGLITGLPAGVLTVAPGENIQARIDSIVATGLGGQIDLLPGIHLVTTTIYILGNGIMLNGAGHGTILRALAGTWVGGAGRYDAVLSVGKYVAAPGAETIVNDCRVQNFAIEQSALVHGVLLYGGLDNTAENITATALANITFADGWACVAFIAMDTRSSSTPGTRLRIRLCTVKSDSPTTHYYCDAFHLDGGNPGGFVGVYGFGHRIIDSSIVECIAESCKETVFELASCDQSYCGSDAGGARGRAVPFSPAGIVIGVIASTECAMVNCSSVNPPTSGALCIYIYGSTLCNLRGNFIDGGANKYVYGIYVLSNSNKNILTNNVIRNISTTGVIVVDGTCSNNTLGPNKFDIIAGAPASNYVDTFSLNTQRPQCVIGVGDPNIAAVLGSFGDEYYDSGGATWYKQTTYPQGVTWVVI